jgi:hypothetical protein
MYPGPEVFFRFGEPSGSRVKLISVEGEFLKELDVENLVNSSKLCRYGSKKNGFSLDFNCYEM